MHILHILTNFIIIIIIIIVKIKNYRYIYITYIHISTDRKKNVLRGLNTSSNMPSANYLSYFVIIFVQV
jgi:hypothetical protein